MIARLACVLTLMLVGWAAAQTSQPLRKGSYDITFEQRSPLSAVEMQNTRYGLTRSADQNYDIAKERFVVIVPDSFDPGSGDWGLLIWCNAGKNASPPRDWESSLASKKLIAIGAYNVGNDRAVGVRIGLAIDAAFNMRQRTPGLAERRVYVSGISGGAKVAGMAAMAFPELLDGAICCAGVNYFRDMPLPDDPNKFWAATFRRPPLPTFQDARDYVGFVLITGVKDGNYQPMKTMHELGFTKDGFKHATFYDVPELGHRTPSADWFEKAVDYLDAIPRAREKKRPPAAAPTSARVAATTLPAARPASAASAKPTVPARLFTIARMYRDNKSPEKARAKLEEIIKGFPQSEEAKTARTMLEQMKSAGG